MSFWSPPFLVSLLPQLIFYWEVAANSQFWAVLKFYSQVYKNPVKVASPLSFRGVAEVQAWVSLKNTLANLRSRLQDKGVLTACVAYSLAVMAASSSDNQKRF